MLNSLFIFIVALFLVIKGAAFSTKYAANLAENFRLSKYTTGFIIVAIISILPETLISINAALEGVPSFGLATLFGSNIADLSLIFAGLVFLTGHGLKIEGKVIKSNRLYPFLLLLPLILGLDGFFSRIEGLSLIVAGAIFYLMAFKNGAEESIISPTNGSRLKNLLFLLGGMTMLLAGSHFVVTSASDLAILFGVSPILIGMLIVGLGTTMPEFFFALKSVRKHENSLAVGDILGTVLADATIVVGILALVNPFSFPVKIIYITGLFMLTASFILFYFMKSERYISKKEAWLLFLFWTFFVLIEFGLS